MDTPDNQTPQPRKHHPGSKGTDAMNKRTPEQRQEYRRQVCDYDKDLIGRGLKFNERMKALAAHFQVSEQQAKTYISWHKEDRNREREEALVETRDDAVAQYQYMYRRAVDAGNMKEARECLEAKVKLMGIAAPVRKESTVTVSAQSTPAIDYSGYSLEKLRQIQQAHQELQKLLAPETPTIIDITPTEEAE